MLTAEHFIEFLVQCWKKSPNEHFFSVENSRICANSEIKGIFRVSSLEDCLTFYSWKGKGFKENKIELDFFHQRFRQSISDNNMDLAADTFKKAYKWGGVRYRTNISGSWLREAYKDGSLVRKISDTTEILSTGTNLKKFDGHNFIMNSGYTKIASLAAPRVSPLIIFDGRVGAALGDLVSIAMMANKEDKISSELLFPWGAARRNGNSRNPSSEYLKFPRLFGGKGSHFKHATAMHHASKIVVEAAKRLTVDPREIEAALFMWGYDVRYKKEHKLK